MDAVAESGDMVGSSDKVDEAYDMQSFPDCVLQAVESPHGTRFLLCPTLAPSQHPPHASSNSDPCSPECPTAPPWLPEREEEGGKGAGPGAEEGDAERGVEKVDKQCTYDDDSGGLSLTFLNKFNNEYWEARL